MNEVLRRMIMMVGIVGIGTILIFLDAPIPITLVATLAFGIIMAMGLGLLKPEDFKKILPVRKKTKDKPDTPDEPKQNTSKKEENKTEKKSIRFKKIFSRFHKNSAENEPPDTPPKKEKKNRLSAGLSATLGSFQASIQKSRDDKHTNKIDSLLNSAIDEPITTSENPSEDELISSQTDNSTDVSDEFGSFDDEDFESLDLLEIEGDDISPDLNEDTFGESHQLDNYESDIPNMDDEINSILLAGNAFDDEDEFASESFQDNTGMQDLSTDTESFDSDEFFVQGIEDGLDEEPFIEIPEISPDKDKSVTLNDTLDELDNISGFEKKYPDDDEFSDFQSVNLEDLDSNELSIEMDDIIIEEEDVDETGILPDDFIPSSDGGQQQIKDSHKTEGGGSLFENTGLITPEIDTGMSFSGKGEYDDILSALESDIKVAKTGPEPSLLRDMKDVHVEAKDLVEELETALKLMGGKPSQPDDPDTRRNK